MQERDIITHNNVRFIRYPEAANLSDTRYYRAWYILNGERTKAYLHRVLWIEANGPIPEGYHIHHIDGNALNNALDNLSCISEAEHVSHHWEASTDEYKAGRKHSLTTLAQEAAKEWHASEEGRAWHGQNAKAFWARRQTTTQSCTVCHKEYETKDRRFTHLKFCSKACQARERRESGLDDISVQCPICGVIFTKNKYAKGKTCNRVCGGKLQSRNATEKRLAKA